MCKSKFILVSIISLCMSIPVVGAENSDGRPGKAALLQNSDVQGALAAVDAWIDGVRIYDQVPGISVGIIFNDELIWSKGYGFSNLESGKPADSDTLYSVCSISKIFTSIGVMQLRDAGLLDLRDSVKSHLPWFDLQQKYENSGPITIESLLTHSSGLPREAKFDYWYNDLDFPTREQLMKTVSEQETLYPSQRHFRYSNLGFTLLGEIIQSVSQQPYAEYMQRNVLDALGLENTRPYYPLDMRGNELAIGYDGIVRNSPRIPTREFYTDAITPAAGYTTSVNDLAKFIIWQFSLLEDKDNSVLSQHTLREMYRVHWVNPDWEVTWGLGFSIRNKDKRSRIGHRGDCPGYVTAFQMDIDNKFGVIVLTNAGDGEPGRIIDNVFSTVLPELKKVKAGDQNDDSIDSFSMYEGNYSEQHWGGEVAIRQWGNKLSVINIPSQSLTVNKIQHDENNVFYREDDNKFRVVDFVFDLDGEGSSIGVKRGENYLKRIE